MTEKTKAWLNPDGSPKKVEELLEISKEWSSKQWEEYAKACEVPQRETILDEGSCIEDFSNESNAFGCDDLNEEDKGSRIKSAMMKQVRALSGEQRHLISLLFGEGMSLSEAVEELGVCKSTVMRKRNRLLEKLKVEILTEVYSLDVAKYLKEVAA